VMTHVTTQAFPVEGQGTLSPLDKLAAEDSPTPWASTGPMSGMRPSLRMINIGSASDPLPYRRAVHVLFCCTHKSSFLESPWSDAPLWIWSLDR
jgi:hypothetical protein